MTVRGVQWDIHGDVSEEETGSIARPFSQLVGLLLLKFFVDLSIGRRAFDNISQWQQSTVQMEPPARPYQGPVGPTTLIPGQAAVLLCSMSSSHCCHLSP